MPFVRVNNIDLHYETYGSEGPQVIVAHGLLGSVDALKLFAFRLDEIAAKGVRIVAYDARGHGRSGYTRDWRDYTWQSLARDMRGVMDALDIEKATIYGGSMGAGTAIAMALAYRQRVDRLILHNPPPTGARLKPVRGIFAGLAILYQLFGAQLAGEIVARLPDRRGDPNFDIAGFLGSQRRDAIVPAIRGVLLDGPQLPTHRYDEIHDPALVLTHPDDPIHPLESGEMLHERLAHAKLAVAPSQSYWAENPDALAHVVASFARGEPIARGLPEHKHQPRSA
jgi:3-oxoadipate enol-lactonase